MSTSDHASSTVGDEAGANKRRMEAIMAAMASGSLGPLFEAMADDVRWRWMGTGPWSRTFEGKAAVVGGLFGAVQDTLTAPFRVVVHALIAEGETVVVEHSGRNATPDGRRYDNRYCWVCRFAGGRLREIREYMDTQLVTETFGAGDHA